jgi:hypothetical protein
MKASGLLIDMAIFCSRPALLLILLVRHRFGDNNCFFAGSPRPQKQAGTKGCT